MQPLSRVKSLDGPCVRGISLVGRKGKGLVAFISKVFKHTKKYWHVHTVHGTVRFSKLQSAEIKHLLNSTDSCILSPQLSAAVHVQLYGAADPTYDTQILTFADTCIALCEYKSVWDHVI